MPDRPKNPAAPGFPPPRSRTEGDVYRRPYPVPRESRPEPVRVSRPEPPPASTKRGDFLSLEQRMARDSVKHTEQLAEVESGFVRRLIIRLAAAALATAMGVLLWKFPSVRRFFRWGWPAKSPIRP